MIIKHCRGSVFAGILIVLAGTSCVTGRPSPRTDDFLSELWCGMTELEVKEVAKRHGFKTGRPERERYKNCMWARKGLGATEVWLEFDDGGLRTYQVSWAINSISSDYDPIRDLCTGQQFVVLSLRIPHAIQQHGTAVFLDGEYIGDTFVGEMIRVPLGHHELRLESPDGRSWTTNLDYNESSDGGQYGEVPLNAFEKDGENFGVFESCAVTP